MKLEEYKEKIKSMTDVEFAELVKDSGIDKCTEEHYKSTCKIYREYLCIDCPYCLTCNKI
jgi:hypothetical protein